MTLTEDEQKKYDELTEKMQHRDKEPDAAMYFERYKWVIPFIAVVIFVALIGSSIGGAYNTIIAKDVIVEQMQGNVQTALERRADLIPNYVESIAGSATFEHDTLTDVIAMRAEANKIKENVKSARTVEEIQQSQDELGAVIGRLLMLNEQYPALQTTAQFKELEAQLTATENQINMERNNYNIAVMDYKVTVRSFPVNLLANYYGYYEDKWAMFSAKPEKQEVPKVNFDKLANLSTSR
jgi:LemA protein